MKRLEEKKIGTTKPAKVTIFLNKLEKTIKKKVKRIKKNDKPDS